MSRDAKIAPRKATRLPRAMTLGHGRWKARPGDWIVYFRSDGSRAFARVIGQIESCDTDGPDCTGWLQVVAVSDNGSFGYERWINPADVIECLDPARVRTFLAWMLSATPADLRAYTRDDPSVRSAAHPRVEV